MVQCLIRSLNRRRAALAVANASKEAASAWLDELDRETRPGRVQDRSETCLQAWLDEHFDDDDIDDAVIGKASAEIVAYLGTLRFDYEEGEEGEEGEKDGIEQGKEDELAALEQGGADAELSFLLQMAGAGAEEKRLSLQHEQGSARREAKSAQPEPSLLESALAGIHAATDEVNGRLNAIKCGLVAADFAEPDEVSDGADGAGEETLSCGDVGAGEAAAADADAAEV